MVMKYREIADLEMLTPGTDKQVTRKGTSVYFRSCFQKLRDGASC